MSVLVIPEGIDDVEEDDEDEDDEPTANGAIALPPTAMPIPAPLPLLSSAPIGRFAALKPWASDAPSPSVSFLNRPDVVSFIQ